MEAAEDKLLLERAGAGEGDAIQVLIVRAHTRLAAIVSKSLQPELRRYLDVEDILQDAYVAAFTHAEGRRFRSADAFFAWLSKIARNRLRDRCRALKAGRRDIDRMETDTNSPLSRYLGRLIDLAPGPDSTPSRKVSRAENRAAVLSALARLPADYRMVVRLRILEQESVAEVAARMKRSEDAVHALMRRALLALRQNLDSLTLFLTRVPRSK